VRGARSTPARGGEVVRPGGRLGRTLGGGDQGNSRQFRAPTVGHAFCIPGVGPAAWLSYLSFGGSFFGASSFFASFFVGRSRISDVRYVSPSFSISFSRFSASTSN